MQTIVNLNRQNTDVAWVLFAHVIAHVNQTARLSYLNLKLKKTQTMNRVQINQNINH